MFATGLATLSVSDDFNPPGQIVILVLIMFVGRVGPIAFGIALFFRRPPAESTEDLSL